MRRRFGRGRRRDEDNRGAPLDASVWIARIAESDLAGGAELAPETLPGVAAESAVLASGDSGELLVGCSPRGGGEALFAVLALAASRPGFAGRALAIAPDWPPAARRRLWLVSSQRFRVRALSAPQLTGAGEVEAASPAVSLPIAPERLAAILTRPEDRDIFARALAGLRGLAAKHAGAVRGSGDRVDLLVLARPVASLRVARSGVRLDLSGPDRASLDLTGDALAAALDRLEGSLRKRLNDRRIRASEEGVRATLLPLLERAGSLRGACAWPVPGNDAGPIDLIGTDPDGRLVVAAARERLDLAALGEVIDAALDPRVRLPLLTGDEAHAAASGAPRLLLAAQECDEAALGVLSLLSLDAEVYAFDARRGPPRLERRPLPAPAAIAPGASAPAAAAPAASPPAATAVPAAPRAWQAPAAAPRPEPPRPAVPAAPRDMARDIPAQREPAPPREPSAPPVAAAAVAREPGGAPADAGADEPARFEEVSLFELEEEEDRALEPGGPQRRRRGRGRRRRRRRGPGGPEAPASTSGGGDDADEDESESEGEAAAVAVAAAPRPAPIRPRAEPEEDELVDDDEMVALADEPPETFEPADLRYEDEEGGEDGDAEEDRARVERERRRHARVAKSEPEEAPRPPRRRAAFVAHADRVSVLSAIVLARDVRLVESFWVYPQEDLMTFFRSVATDLREETPIFLIGFAASPPARDTIQAASLYRGRLHWFDHHPWPPEDLVALGEAIGADAVHVEQGAESSLARVIGERTRRSRFSDKLVELVTGRFTSHDYERWGRLWWHRAGDIASRRGDRRADIEPLLAGRPSDLARDSARMPVPPPPPELEFVARHDFRLVHFGGYVMVVLDVPPQFDLHLTARIARERYGAQLSLAAVEGGDLLVLGGDESRARRGLDLGSMADHLASKHEWITALSDADHVARVRVQDLRTVPGRLDEVIGEIAMGRSIVEG
jgi:hypothetical protein